MRAGGARGLWRAAREFPVIGAVVHAADRLWWARAIDRSGLVDSAYYAALLGRRRMSERAVIAHYVTRGFRRGLSPNPLFDELYTSGKLPEAERVPALYAYLVSDRPSVSVHPWWDSVAWARRGGIVDRADGAIERVWAERASASIQLAIGGIAVDLPVDRVRSWAIDAAQTWACTEEVIPSPPSSRAVGTSIVRIVQRQDRRYSARLAQLVRFATSGEDTLVVFSDPDASAWVSAALLAKIDPRVRLGRVGRRRTWGETIAAAADISAGDVFVALDARVEMDDDDIRRLSQLARSGVAAIPATRAIDGTVTGLGAAHVGAALPYAILAHHPQEDLDSLGDDPIDVPLLTGRTFALPRSWIADAGGFDMSLVNQGELEALSDVLKRDERTRLVVDPSLRPVQEEPERAFARRRRRPFADAVSRGPVEGGADAAQRILERAGFRFEGWDADAEGRPVPRLAWVRSAPTARRWAIKICAPAGRPGAVWGDTHFATGLAQALRRRGHVVVIDAFEARARPTAYLDDVSVVVRGPYRIDPPATGVSIEWIISHPDEITRAEAAGFDRVFAASVSWAHRSSERWGLRVDPLLEATDTDHFQPAGLERGTDIVFVGTARGIPRPSVVAPLAAGIPVRVYGPDWRPFIPPSAIASWTIPNRDLPARYETASIVLNDQWPAMRREGFIAMRPFDAVAVGGRVVSETVEGIEEIFDGAVVTYRDAAHLVELLRADPADLFPTQERMAEISERIRREHSFDARAAVLDEAAAESAAEAQRARR